MSKSEMERFVKAVRSDKGLQEELKEAAISNEALVVFAKNKGYDVELKEMAAFVEEKKAALSIKDLDKITGGQKQPTAVSVVVVT